MTHLLQVILLFLQVTIQFALAWNNTSHYEVARLIEQHGDHQEDVDVIDLRPPSQDDKFSNNYLESLDPDESSIHEVQEYSPSARLPPGVQWNEEGQYWGYQRVPNIDGSWSVTGCIPPYCIPALCSQGGPGSLCPQSCVTQNCDIGCFPYCIGGSQCIRNVCRCNAFIHQSNCNIIPSLDCRNFFGIFCANGCFKPTSVASPPECDCIIPYYVLRQPMCATETLQSCPNNCSNHGTCDHKVGECICDTGFTGPDCSLIDHCVNNPDLPPCEYGCISLNDTRLCTCPDNLVLQPDGVSCDNPCPPGLTGPQCSYDIDECLTGIHECQYFCKNTFGSYECQCLPGMVLDPQNNRTCLGRTCEPACIQDQGECVEGGFCKCHPGFNGPSCESDVDECALGTSGCNHDCINTYGSFRCLCRPGFELDPRNNKTCIAKSCNPPCVPGQGDCVDGRCQCHEGFEGIFCERDVDECAERTHNCEQKCVNIYGSFQCACYDGYRPSPREPNRCERVDCVPPCVQGQGYCRDGICECVKGYSGRACERDVDECSEGRHDCEQKCVNTPGSFRCACYDGYRPLVSDARRCVPIRCDPSCVPGQGECQSDVCVCKEGFTGKSCEKDIDECLEGTHGCEHNCINTHGSYNCTCRDGYQVSLYDPKRCEPVRCDPDCIPGQGVCMNGVCKCHEGFTGESCAEDINECELRIDGCDHICINQFGSYECACNPGYDLSLKDSRTCVPGDCLANCVPGKGDCDIYGRCICRPGYEGPYCQHEADVCSSGHHQCEHICVSLPGKKHLCRCYPGYIVDPKDPNRCIVYGCEPPCEIGQGLCDYESKKCVCESGFMGDRCETNINECAVNNGGCSHICVDTHGAFTCDCPPGMQLVENSTFQCVTEEGYCDPPCYSGRGTCVRENYCKCKEGFSGQQCENIHDGCLAFKPCEQECVSLEGGRFECRCFPGYIPSQPNFFATRCVLECQEGKNCIHGQCSSGKCICKAGYTGENCDKDVNECQDRSRCEQRCINTPGSYNCECESGYALQPDGYSCRRVEVPVEKPPKYCTEGVDCLNGKFLNGQCICKSGYAGECCERDIDECTGEAGSRAQCEQICINTRGSYECQCESGFQLQPDGYSCRKIGLSECKDGVNCFHGCCSEGECICRSGFTGDQCERDIDECSGETGIRPRCEQRCINILGSYECDCDPGFILQPDGFSCRRNETSSSCQDSSNCFHGDCLNGRCVCQQGFTGNQCEMDINECEGELGTYARCTQRCINTLGSYECECEPGYELGPDGYACFKVDSITECKDGVNCIHGVCSEGECICRSGFTGEKCERDINECLGENGIPPKCEQRCINIPGSYDCGCEAGYVLQTNGYSCRRETYAPSRPVHNCREGFNCFYGRCSNDYCVCEPGFTGDQCERDIDECAGELGTKARCEHRCINTPGSYKCQCESGYILQPNGYSCRNSEPVLEWPLYDCRHNETCIYGDCVNGKCYCRPGFTGEMCDKDVNECEGEIGFVVRCQQRCVNTFGSFRCECESGYELQTDGFSCGKAASDPECKDGFNCIHGRCWNGQCVCLSGYTGENCDRDIDECIGDVGVQHQCEQQCINKPGSYYCQCYSGYELQPDGFSCRRADVANEWTGHHCQDGVNCIYGNCVNNDCICQQGFAGDRCDKDINECVGEMGSESRCEQICINTHGSYECQCEIGYELKSNGYSCRPSQSVSNCLEGENCFYGRCMDDRCICESGYTGSKCERDIDECSGELGIRVSCEHLCVNTHGSYECQCHPGYDLQSDGFSCQPGGGKNRYPGGCLNGGISLECGCKCPVGFRGSRCEEVVDICKEKNPCEHICYNKSDGGYMCGCYDGYELNSDGKTCGIPVECNPPCTNNGHCFRGKCICPSGFRGVSCDEDVDECAMPAVVHGCAHGCRNTYGSYECICPQGYILMTNKRTCTPVASSIECVPPCRNGGICQSNNICSCPRGFEGDDCSKDIDECTKLSPCDPEFGSCINRVGGYECICLPGYILLLDGKHCIEESRARQAPHLIFRGVGTKGITTGTQQKIAPRTEVKGASSLTHRQRRRLKN
ncbi:unnamed protein product [Hymenolepis diminuta]|uniref:Multiple epidermal growth factor-like domains protein 11 n=1 Tax=Hymenolepis diminuta TaxID=6216 RepID=A0A0R3SU55_HYMDI|nr:unnamed protein product [Hymenolepis diminuta]VUZ50678.1 unnamed protein product [Hymenolepis diminuta]